MKQKRMQTAAIERWKAKKERQRNSPPQPAILYKCRSESARRRPRVGGRFVSRKIANTMTAADKRHQRRLHRNTRKQEVDVAEKRRRWREAKRKSAAKRRHQRLQRKIIDNLDNTLPLEIEHTHAADHMPPPMSPLHLTLHAIDVSAHETALSWPILDDGDDDDDNNKQQHSTDITKTPSLLIMSESDNDDDDGESIMFNNNNNNNNIDDDITKLEPYTFRDVLDLSHSVLAIWYAWPKLPH